eukprot:TRINITY_DN4158_c0_g1_i1.p1 TRINITY_DN4158_c0_g1~~TRINITY_DN4158_c0_g1_i1.p1  ORF type:complete len:410 (+),score=57.36 TRINITY_DN4158_c0_g1_i1:73-1302(+)
MATMRIAFGMLLCCICQCRDVKPQAENYLPNYTIYHNATRIAALIETLTHHHSNFIKYHLLLSSQQGAPIPILRVTNFDDSPKAGDRIKVLIMAGEHARELFPVELALRLLNRVARAAQDNTGSGNTNTKLMQWLLASYDLFIAPMANPDGRQRLETDHNYCWRGNARGVDLNRNFAWDWGGQGASRQPEDEEYCGESAFSERETQGLLKVMSDDGFDVVLSLHSGIRQIYTPFSDRTSWSTGRSPRFARQMQTILETALTIYDQQQHTHPFQAGPAHEVNDYPASGTSFDYACGALYVPLCFAIELYGEGDGDDNQCFDLFNPPSEQLDKHLQIAETMLISLLKSIQAHWDEELAAWRLGRYQLMPQNFAEQKMEVELTWSPILLSAVTLLAMIVMAYALCVRQRSSS